ncbi:hypothetical protein QQF64_015600 [Cirrhinus molitorella]|uniref:Uncharacterized protein n=1 Tax=Cirrhinus molitorella TaxID=172907 RepID=A0ABR3NVR0_9TELE
MRVDVDGRYRVLPFASPRRALHRGPQEFSAQPFKYLSALRHRQITMAIAALRAPNEAPALFETSAEPRGCSEEAVEQYREIIHQKNLQFKILMHNESAVFMLMSTGFVKPYSALMVKDI